MALSPEEASLCCGEAGESAGPDGKGLFPLSIVPHALPIFLVIAFFFIEIPSAGASAEERVRLTRFFVH